MSYEELYISKTIYDRNILIVDIYVRKKI